MTENKAFRDYATRVSFNITLSRNQVATLRHVVFDIENENRYDGFDARHRARVEAQCDHRSMGLADMYVIGLRVLYANGLIEADPRFTAENERFDKAVAHYEKHGGSRPLRKYWGPSNRLTAAGEHVVALLRIAGLIQMPASNTNARKRRAS